MTKPLVQAVANVTVQIGETAKLECRVASDPLPYIRFMKTINDTEYEVIKLRQFQNRTSVESISPSIKTEFFERFLSIHNVTFADEGVSRNYILQRLKNPSIFRISFCF